MRRQQPGVPAEGQPVTIEDYAVTPVHEEAMRAQCSPQLAPVAFGWRDTSGARYRLVMRQTESGQRQLITEFCQQDSLGNDSWRVLEVPRVAQADCVHVYDALRALEIALARVTLGYPD
jgi:hypothetical protein